MAEGEGFAIEPNMHFASEFEDRIQSEDLASLQIAAVQDTFAEMSGHKCCQADWSMGRWVDAMEFSRVISEDPSLDYWMHLHSYGAGEKH